jgi:putative DNA primase/helicase
VSILNAISGEDRVKIDRKYQTAWEGPLPTRNVIASNHPLNFGDTSGAFAARIVPLKMVRSFLYKEDHNLGERLHAELPAILNWSLDGLRRLEARGNFIIPASARDIIEHATPTIARFIEDRCLLLPNVETIEDDLFAEWKSYSADEGHQPGSKTHLAAEIASRYPGEIRYERPNVAGGGRVRLYTGIALNSLIDERNVVNALTGKLKRGTAVEIARTIYPAAKHSVAKYEDGLHHIVRLLDEQRQAGRYPHIQFSGEFWLPPPTGSFF